MISLSFVNSVQFMQRARRQPVVPIDLEIKRTARRLNRERRERVDIVVETEEIAIEMVEPENRTLREF